MDIYVIIGIVVVLAVGFMVLLRPKDGRRTRGAHSHHGASMFPGYAEVDHDDRTDWGDSVSGDSGGWGGDGGGGFGGGDSGGGGGGGGT